MKVFSYDANLSTVIVRLKSEVFKVDNMVWEELKNKFRMVEMIEDNERIECGISEKIRDMIGKPTLVKWVRVS